MKELEGQVGLIRRLLIIWLLKELSIWKGLDPLGILIRILYGICYLRTLLSPLPQIRRSSAGLIEL
jgi:hypothetical protein